MDHTIGKPGAYIINQYEHRGGGGKINGGC